MSTLTLSFTPTESTPCPASPSTPSTTRVSGSLSQVSRNVVDTSTRVLSGNLYNDLALVTLQEAVDTDKFSHIGPVCLPHHAQVTHHTLQQYCNLSLV